MILTTLLQILLLLPYAISHPTSRTVSVTSTSKAGIAGGWDDLGTFTSTGKVSWFYSWNMLGPESDLDFVPMLWGEKDITDWTSGINDTIAKRKPTAILGMNEPQEKGQSNLTPQQGADMWKTYLEPLRSHGVRLGSPAPSSAPSGLTWLQDFLTACAGGCTVDFIALHYYDVNATKFAEYLTNFHDTFQRPIWVTEWACQNFNKGPQCSADDVVRFLDSTQSFMDQQDWVERYSWFGAMRDLQGVNTANALEDKDGHITDLGKQYIGLEGPKTNGGPQTSGAPPTKTTGAGGLPGLPTSGVLGRGRGAWGALWPALFILALL